MRILTLLTMPFLTGGIIATAHAATIDVHQADLPVFVSGDGTYYRLPSILVTGKGTVLAACQKRKGSRGDWAESALVLKRSTDGGRTWGPEQTLYERPGHSAFNGNLVLIRKGVRPPGLKGSDPFSHRPSVEDRQAGELLATFIAFPTKAGAAWFTKTWIPAGGGFDLVRSDDDGRKWSPPEHHDPAPNADGWHGGAAYNNNHGVQLTHGPHAGRLVLGARVFKKGVYEDRAKGGVVYSDDHGRSWRVGGAGFPGQGRVNGEVTLCETSAGEVYVNYRNCDSRASPRCRLYSRSRDGGATFYQEGAEEDLPAHGCNAGLVSFTPAGADKPLLLFTYPLEPSRHKLVGYVSTDNGQTWSGTNVISQHGGYSDVAVLQNGTILVLYEKSRAAGLCLARFSLAQPP